MAESLLHVFENSPGGRETFLRSLHFCRRTAVGVAVYAPRYDQFMMYFEADAVLVHLDAPYLRARQNARAHAATLAAELGLEPRFVEPTSFTGSATPDLSPSHDYMCCPRGITDVSARIKLGQIGATVRRIIRHAAFPVLIPGATFEPWKRVVAFYGGSEPGRRAVGRALLVAEAAGVPVLVFSWARDPDELRAPLAEHGYFERLERLGWEWVVRAPSMSREQLYDVPRDALLVVGSHGHGLVKDMVFGSFMEDVQSTMPNDLLVVGPRCR